jgi:DNA-binding XRE family transcriptional regulator
MADNNGENIRARRVARGLSQKDLAAAVGISPERMCLIESGKRKADVYTAVRIAKHLRTTVEKLWPPNKK